KEAVTVKAVFKKKVSITLVKEGEGTLAIEGYDDEALQTVAEGTELTVVATPKKGYMLTSLTAGTQDILETKRFTVTGAVTVKAVFKEIEKVSITLAKEGEGTLAIEGYNEEALQAVAEGTELTVIATPKEGYTLTSLMAGTQDILATKKFTVKEAVTVKAVFKKKVSITLAKEGEGTLAIEGYNEEALKAVAEGTELTVIATPKEGYKLTSLTTGTQDILETKKFTVKEAVTVKAVFKKKVAITLDKEGEGTLSIEGYNEEALQAVAEGTELTVIATPKEGYTLTSLMAGTQDILATKKFTVTGAVTVKAVFKKNGGSNPGGGNNGGGNNGGGNNGGGTWQPQTPKAVEDAVLASLAVAPNPFTSQVRIENPEGVAVRYELVNASGLVVRSGSFVTTEVIVDTEALPAGLYFVRIEAKNGAKRVVKVVKY
ncbi:MAG: T9SS type A sorting domain-containing protein, partial [Bacteroides sp.]